MDKIIDNSKHDKILRITLDTYREKFKTFEWDNMKIEDKRIIVYSERGDAYYNRMFVRNIQVYVKMFELINQVAANNAMRVNTSVINQVLNEAIALVQPPTDKGRRLKMLYATQASTKPPTFVIFVNNKELFHFSYERYLVNQIRTNFGLEGTPIRVISREKGEKGE